MTTPSINNLADSADALLVARRAKNWTFALLLAALLVQMGIFFVLRYTQLLQRIGEAQPSRVHVLAAQALHGLSVLSCFAGVALSVVLVAVLLLVVLVMLVGRTLGVAGLTRAWVWALVLVVLLFPWQMLLGRAAGPGGLAGKAHPTTSAVTPARGVALDIPGVLHTWSEVRAEARFDGPTPTAKVLKWSRYVGFPLVAVVVLLAVQAGSARGLRLALGRDLPLENPPPTPVI